jgi:2-keto-4-pentenoate hydratase/2-oxohepta-3-ene-1,7-dioic acid hydratase in catechol pathway
MICIGLNYVRHVEEMGRRMPTVPGLFLKLPSALAGHGQDIVKPKVSDDFDYEGELVVVIGKACHRVPEAAAPGVVAGYTILNDGSIRDWQKENVCAGKNFPRTSGFGPWLVTADEIPDPDNVPLRIFVNGEKKQESSTKLLIFDCRKLIEWGSTFYTFHPGDVLFTGTPEGVSPVKPGDVMRAEIDPIGAMTIAVRAHKPGA